MANPTGKGLIPCPPPGVSTSPSRQPHDFPIVGAFGSDRNGPRKFSEKFGDSAFRFGEFVAGSCRSGASMPERHMQEVPILLGFFGRGSRI